MSTTAVQQSSASSLSFSESRAVEQIDSLAREFLECERIASEAYDAAYMLDSRHESAKIRLISLLWDSALQQDDWRILRGSHYQAQLKLVPSETIDSSAISAFRDGLIRELRPQGMLTDIFQYSVSWRFTEDAHKIIAKFKMSDHLAELYSKCRLGIETPILEVRQLTP